MKSQHLKQATGWAHAKVILMGEHAVVHGSQAIALPIPSIPVKVTITQLPHQPVTIESAYYQGVFQEAPITLHNLWTVYQETLRFLKVAEIPIHIHIHSEIPQERGMGSSAAVTTAFVKALARFYQKELSKKQLYWLVNLGETIAHGNASGLDTVVTSASQPVLFSRGVDAKLIDSQLAGYLVIADSGIQGNTRQAVELVQSHLNNHPATQQIIAEIDGLVQKALKSLTGNQVGALADFMNQNHRYLQQLSVSVPKIDTLIDTALKAGALGAKITGAGLGGCIIALCPTKSLAHQVKHSLKTQDVDDVWLLDFNSYQSKEDY